LEQTEPISTLKALCYRRYSFQILNRFTRESNALDVAASKTDGFLWSDICVSSGVLSRPIRANLAHIHLENYDLQDVFHK
jgi:hypothetical protein